MTSQYNFPMKRIDHQRAKCKDWTSSWEVDCLLLIEFKKNKNFILSQQFQNRQKRQKRYPPQQALSENIDTYEIINNLAIVERSIINTPNTHIHDWSLSWLGTIYTYSSLYAWRLPLIWPQFYFSFESHFPSIWCAPCACMWLNYHTREFWLRILKLMK